MQDNLVDNYKDKNTEEVLDKKSKSADTNKAVYKRDTVLPKMSEDIKLYFNFMITSIRQDIFNMSRQQFVNAINHYAKKLEPKSEIKELSYYAYLTWENGTSFPLIGNIILLLLFYRENNIDITLEELLLSPRFRRLCGTQTTKEWLSSLGNDKDVIDRNEDFKQKKETETISSWKVVDKSHLVLFSGHSLYYQDTNGIIEEVLVSTKIPALLHSNGNEEYFFDIPDTVTLYYSEKVTTYNNDPQFTYQGTPILSLDEAIQKKYVWIELLNEQDLQIRNAFAGYYTYNAGTGCFCNADFSIRLLAKNYGKIFVACADPIKNIK